MSHFPALCPPLNTPDTHQPWVLPPPCCLHPSCTLQPRPAGPCGAEGDPDPAVVSLPTGSVRPQLKSQSDTSVKCNCWQDALGSGSTSHRHHSTKPPSKSAPQGPKTHPGPQTQPGPHCCNGASTSGRHIWGHVSPLAQCHPWWRLTQPIPSATKVAWSPGAGVQSPPEQLIPSTSYRRSLDLVSSWCEAVITLISSGIAFPPRANFVSTVTSPRGVRVLQARWRQEPQQPNQAPQNHPETRGHPQIPISQGLGQPCFSRAERFKRVLGAFHHPNGVICCQELPSGSGEGTGQGERDRRLTVPKSTGGFRSGQSLGSFLAAGICCNPISP